MGSLFAHLSIATDLVTIIPDPVTGKMTKTVYTKYFDAGVWMVPGRVGMSVVVDQLREDLGKMTIYIWNRDKEPHSVRITKATVYGSNVRLDKTELVAVAGERSGLEVGKFEDSNYGTQMEVVVGYEMDGAPAELALRLERRTAKDMKRFFGKHGKPPYPWYQD